MGHFYVNTTLRGPSQEHILRILHQYNRNAYVSPTENSYTVVFDEECDDQDTDIIHNFSILLSHSLQCIALTVLNHDDDIFWYKLYENGKLIDTYDSNPEFFSGIISNPIGGDCDLLCRIFQIEEQDELKQILYTPTMDDEAYYFAVNRHAKLVKLLGLPEYAVGIGYEDIEDDNVAEDIDLSNFRHT